MNANADKLAAQIGVMNLAIKRQFSTDPAINANLIARLCDQLDAAGVTSIFNIANYTDPTLGVSFYYDMVTGHVFQSPRGSVTDDGAYYGLNTFTVLGVDNRFNYWVILTFTKDGFPVFMTHEIDNGSDWQDFRTGVIFVVGVVVSFAFPALGQVIGQAVFGASVPAAVATAVGNIAVTAALNGGDVQAAVVSAVSGGLGSAVGGVATTASGAQWIGSAAGAATTALVKGGDPAFAVASSLITSGASSMDDILFPDDSIIVPDTGAFESGFDPTASGLVSDYTFGGSVVSGYDAYGDAGFPDSAPASSVSAPAGSAASGSTNYAALISAGLALVKAFTGAGSPAVRTYTATQQAKPNGTVTQYVNGKAVTGKPPVGVPYQTATGAVITNNGDGTYTTVSPSGVATVSRYSAVSLSGVNPMVIGAGVLAVLLLTRR